MFNKIDKLTETEFTEVFGNIFENASWIAVKLYKEKPFYNFGIFI
jgi:2-oxo-4-hydroxy-4-carboxy--5-ureidoimidazoline (OHCU) decarboxylase